jgi:hypothetical protein
MINAVADMAKLAPTAASTTQSQTAVAPVNSNQKSGPSQPPSAAGIQNDTVSISSAAHAAQLEAGETPVQTAQEARSGDLQAQTLLAKEAAAQRTQK